MERDGVAITEEELDAIMSTEVGKNLCAQLRQLRVAEEEQETLQDELRSRIERGEGSGENANSPTEEEISYMTAIIQEQKGVALEREQIMELLSTPHGKEMVVQVRQLLHAQKSAQAADEEYQNSLSAVTTAGDGEREGDGENISLNDDDMRAVSDLFFQQKGVRLSQDDLNLVMKSKMGQQLAEQLRQLRGAESGAESGANDGGEVGGEGGDDVGGAKNAMDPRPVPVFGVW